MVSILGYSISYIHLFYGAIWTFVMVAVYLLIWNYENDDEHFLP